MGVGLSPSRLAALGARVGEKADLEGWTCEASMTQQMGGVKASFDVEESWLPTRARWARSPH